MEESNKKTIITNFVKAQDHRTIPIDGVLGGFNHSGKLVMNCYVDSIGTPDKIVLEVVPAKGNMVSHQEIQGSANDEAVKEIQVSISMNYDISKKVLLWITEHLKNFEKFNPLIPKEKD